MARQPENGNPLLYLHHKQRLIVKRGGRELIQLAKDIRAAERRGAELGLTEDEIAFYDALETNDSAVKVLGDEALRTIAREPRWDRQRVCLERLIGGR